MTPMIVARVFLPFAFGYFLSYLLRAINAVIGPELVAEFGLDAAELGLMTSVYLLAFSMFQPVLGVLLDRFGPRLTQAVLLLVATAGTLVFAFAGGFGALIVGRALIGLGVAGCLMAAFTAFATWFPRDRLPLINGLQMVSGGLGALAATAPVEAALRVTDWRGVFLVVAGALALAALAMWWAVPKRKAPGGGQGLADMIAGYGTILTDHNFLRIAPMVMIYQAAFLSVQGLWAAPWLRDVAGLDRAEVARVLLLIAAAMMGGFLTLGALADRLRRFGVRPMAVALGGAVVTVGVHGLVVAEWASAPAVLWMLVGFFGTSSIIPYAALSQSFPPQLAGRVNTALNTLAFAGSFALQWGIGVVIGLWPATAAGGYDAAGYRAAFIMIVVLEALGLAWYALFRGKPPVTA